MVSSLVHCFVCFCQDGNERYGMKGNMKMMQTDRLFVTMVDSVSAQ